MAALSLAGKLDPAASPAVSDIQPTAAPCDAAANREPDHGPRTAQWVSNLSQNTPLADRGEALPSLPFMLSTKWIACLHAHIHMHLKVYFK